HMLARSSLSFTLGFEPVPDDAIHLADTGDVAIMTNDSDDRVRALVRLNQFGDVYLYVGRFIEPRVLNHMEETQRAAAPSEQREANRQLDERRRFTETVLTGVSAGIIGLDSLGRINLPNRSASSLLGTDLEQVLGQDLAEVAPEMAGLLGEAERRPDRLAQS